MMKRAILSLGAVVWLAVMLPAQITLNLSDYPDIGDDIFYFTDTLPVGATVGMAGANQTWDFSMLNEAIPSVSSFIDPDDGINSSDFPTADLAQVSQGINSYVEIGTSEITLLGAAGDLFGTGENISLIYDPTALVSEFPLTYNTSYSASYGIDITFSNPNLMVDSIRIKTIVMEEVTIDGWGTAILPSGSYDCLREKTISTSIDSSWVYFFGQAFLTTDSIVETNYAWLAAESKGLLVNTILNEEGDSLLGVTFFDSISVVQVAPVAAFSAEDEGDGVISFTDESSNVPTEWEWDFGDGNTSTQQNPVHLYATPGTYNVCLTVANTAGSDQICQDVGVDIQPSAAFSFQDQGAGEILFTDESTGAPTSWSWDFGDGGTSTEQNPTYTYSVPGDYTVCLTVTNASGMDEVCETVTISLAPVALFMFEPQGGGTYQFTDESLNNPTSWSWDFGDGNTSTEQNPEHTYNVVGEYQACLMVANAIGSSQACGTIMVMTASQKDVSNLITLQVFPNPTSERVSFQTDAPLSNKRKTAHIGCSKGVNYWTYADATTNSRRHEYLANRHLRLSGG
jgi:PKD repeat protein